MSDTVARTRARGVHPAFGLLLAIFPALAAIVGLWTSFGESYDFYADDYAIAELSMRSFWSGDQWVGVLARGSWRTLGPAQLVWLGPWYLLGGSNSGALALGAVTWTLLWSAVMWATMVRGLRVGALQAGAALVVAQAWLGVSTDPLNSYMMLFPLMAAVLAAAAAFRGGWDWVVLYAVATSVATQISFPAGLPCAVIGIAVLARARSQRALGDLPWTTTLAAMTVAWFPTAVDQLLLSGNISTLVSGDDVSVSRERATLRTFIEPVAENAALTYNRFPSVPVILEAALDPQWALVWMGLALLALVLVVGGWRSESRDITGFAIAGAVTTMAVAWLIPGFRDHYLTPLAGLSMVVAVVVLTSAPKPVLAGCAALGLVVLVVRPPLDVLAEFRLSDNWESDPVIEQAIGFIGEAPFVDGAQVHVIPDDDLNLYLATGMVLELHKLGYDVTTTEEWHIRLGVPVAEPQDRCDFPSLTLRNSELPPTEGMIASGNGWTVLRGRC